MQVDPGFIRIRKRVKIETRDAITAEDRLTCLQMPPEIGVVQRKTQTQECPNQDRGKQDGVPRPRQGCCSR